MINISVILSTFFFLCVCEREQKNVVYKYFYLKIAMIDNATTPKLWDPILPSYQISLSFTENFYNL